MARGFDPNAVACDYDHLIFWLVLIDPTFTCDARTIERCRAEKTTWKFFGGNASHRVAPAPALLVPAGVPWERQFDCQTRGTATGRFEAKAQTV